MSAKTKVGFLKPDVLLLWGCLIPQSNSAISTRTVTVFNIEKARAMQRNHASCEFP